MAGEREEVVGDHVLFELESPASEREKFALLRGCSPVHFASGGEFEDRHHSFYQAEFPEASDSWLEIVTIGIEDVSCFYCKEG